MGMPIDHLRGAGTCICEFLSAVPAAGRPRTLLADPSIILLAATSSDSDQTYAWSSFFFCLNLTDTLAVSL